MKKLIQISVIVTGLFLSLLSFTTGQDERTLGNVRKVQGKYMFTSCEPIKEYEPVFNVKIGAVWSNSQINDVPEIEKMALKRAMKKNQEFDGLIVNAIDDITAFRWK